MQEYPIKILEYNSCGQLHVHHPSYVTTLLQRDSQLQEISWKMFRGNQFTHISPETLETEYESKLESLTIEYTDDQSLRHFRHILFMIAQRLRQTLTHLKLELKMSENGSILDDYSETLVGSIALLR